MFNTSMTTTISCNHFAKPSNLKSKHPPKFGMTARNPTNNEKEASARLNRCGNVVIAEKIQNIWIIFIDETRRILGQPGRDLQEISGLVDEHQFQWVVKDAPAVSTQQPLLNQSDPYLNANQLPGKQVDGPFDWLFKLKWLDELVESGIDNSVD